MILTRMLAGLCLASAVMSIQAAHATACDLDPDNYALKLRVLVDNGCYDKLGEFAALRNRARAELQRPSGSWPKVKARAADTLAWIIAGLDELPNDRDGAARANEHARAMLDRIRAAAGELRRSDFDSVLDDGLEQWRPSRWQPGASEMEDEWHLLQVSLQASGCIDKVSVSCEPVFSAYLENARYLAAMKIVSDFVLAGPAAADIARQETLRKQWRSYLEDQQFQFWWELSANYCLFNPRYTKPPPAWKRVACFVPGLSGTLARRWAGESAATGWVSPPSQRVVYLHPDVGFMYAQNQPDGTSSQPALVMQWLGLLWWDGYEAGGRMYDAYGVSIVSTIADLPESDSVGIGLMAHVRNYGLAVTRHSDDWAVYLNFDLLGRARDTEQQVRSIAGRLGVTDSTP